MSSVSVEPAEDYLQDEEILNINLTQEEAPVAIVAGDKWLVDISVLSREAQFRIDTGAECSTLTLNSYQILEHQGELKSSNRVLRSYSNHRLRPVAAVDLPLKYKVRELKAELEIMDIAQENLLSAIIDKASTDNDTTLKPNAPAGLSDFPELTRTSGTLPGKYTIKINPEAKGVVHLVCWQPAALREKILDKLAEMVRDGHIIKVDQPTEWVSSMVVVAREDKIRICIDPSDLNKAIKREHHPMRTIE